MTSLAGRKFTVEDILRELGSGPYDLRAARNAVQYVIDTGGSWEQAVNAARHVAIEGGPSRLTTAQTGGSTAGSGDGSKKKTQEELDDEFVAAMAAEGYVQLPNGDFFNTKDGKTYTLDDILNGTGRAGGPTGSTAYNGPSYSTQIIGGQVYRISNRDGIPEPTGVMVPPGISATQIDRSGNLIGIKEDGTAVTIIEGFDYPQADPNIETFVDATTGETKSRNKITGEVKTVGKFDFAKIDPKKIFDEEVRVANAKIAADAAAEAGLNRRADQTESGINSRFAQTEARSLEEMRRTRGLAENQAVADILARPADFLARAFLQRGVQSPLQQITQADLVKSLRESISSASGGNVAPAGNLVSQPGGTSAPQPAPSSTPASAVSPGPIQNAIAPITSADVPNLASNMQGIGWVEGVGFVVPSAPAGAPAAPTAPAGGERAALQAAYDAIQAGGGGNIVREYLGSGAAPQTVSSPLLNISSQQEIIDTARRYSPPAVNAVINGTTETMQPLNLGFATPTPRQTSRLTPAETEAFGTRLAAEFNTDLNDVAAQQASLFGKNRSTRMSRLVV